VAGCGVAIGGIERQMPPTFCQDGPRDVFKIDEKIIWGEGVVANPHRSRGHGQNIFIDAPTFIALETPPLAGHFMKRVCYTLLVVFGFNWNIIRELWRLLLNKEYLLATVEDFEVGCDFLVVVLLCLENALNVI